MQQSLASYRNRSKRLKKLAGGGKLPNSVEKRNARERTRVHTVNQAFHILRYRLPALRANTKRVSKLKILKATIQYIYALTDILEVHPLVQPDMRQKMDLPSNTMTVHHHIGQLDSISPDAGANSEPSLGLKAPTELNPAIAFPYQLADVSHHIYNPAVAHQLYRDVIYHPTINVAHHHDVFSTLRQLP